MQTMEQMIPLRQFTTGLRIVTYQRIQPIAASYAVPGLDGHLDRALAHERETRALENFWSKTNRTSVYPAEVFRVDNIVDQVLTAIRNIAAAQAAGLLPSAPRALMIAAFLAEIFPNGVAAITSLPYVDQIAAVEIIIRKLQTSQSAVVSELGLDHKLQQLVELATEYRRLVNLGRTDVAFVTVREARQRGQLYLREIVGLIIGHCYDSDNPDHVEAREALLAPIREQLAELHRKARARRQGRTDADAEAVAASESDAEAEAAVETEAVADATSEAEAEAVADA